MAIRALPPQLKVKAQIELNEDPNVLRDSLHDIKDWIASQPHLRARTDDQWLAAFLRGCKYNMQRVKDKIDLYYSLRSTSPDLYCIKYSGPRFFEIHHLGAFTMLSRATSPIGPKVNIIRPRQFDPSKYSMMEVMAVAAFVQQISMLEDDNYVVAGSINVVDMDGASFSHYTSLSPMQIKKLVISTQDAVPVRLKGIHFLNTPSIFEKFFYVARNFLSEKNKNRIYIHNNKDYESLYKHLPKECLPKDYGGTGSSIQENIDYWDAKLRTYSSWFEEDLQYGTDESKRNAPKKNKFFSLFGGPFKRLQID